MTAPHVVDDPKDTFFCSRCNVACENGMWRCLNGLTSVRLCCICAQDVDRRPTDIAHYIGGDCKLCVVRP